MIYQENDTAGARISTHGYETNTAPRGFLAVPMGPLGMTLREWA